MNTDTTQICSEFSFLITCSKSVLSSEDKKKLLRTLGMKNLQEQVLISLAHKHAVLPLLYKMLKNIAVQDSLTLRLKPYYMNVVQKNMSMVARLIAIAALLNKYDIPSLSFKGAVLSQIAYGDITFRQYGDLDILIQKKDRYNMLSLLKNEDYIAEIDISDKNKKIFLDTVNVLGFQCPSKETFIEIHWELLSKNYAIFWKEEALWKNTSTIYINHQAINTLDFENTLLYLCTHGSKHLFERLSWVCDIDRLVRSKKNINWDALITTSTNLGITRIALLSLNLTQKLLDLPLPQQIIDEIHQDKKVDILTHKIINLYFIESKSTSRSYSTFKLLWDMREKTSDKLYFAYLALIHPKLDDFKFVQLPRYLTFLYPLVRPLRLIFKYFK